MQRRDKDFSEIPEYKRKSTIQVSRRSEPVKKWQFAIIVVAIILFIIFGSVMAFGFSMLNSIHKINEDEIEYAPTDIVDHNVTGSGIENIGTAEEDTEINKEELLSDTKVVSPEVQSLEDQVINILLIGEEGVHDDVDHGRSDASLILTINKEQKSLKLTSLMRDIKVRIPGYLDNKLNAAFHNGRGKLLRETVELNFGIQIDGYVIVNFEGFEDIVDALGGVEIELTENEASYLNSHNYISKKKYRNVVPGKQVLNGNQTLGYCRIRYVDPTGDFGRTERQRRVLLTLFDKYKSQNPVNMVKIAQKLLNYVSTNMDNSEIVQYVTEAAMLGCDTIETLNIPVEGSYVGGTAEAGATRAWVFTVDWDITRAEIVNFIYGSSHIAEMGADPSKLISTDPKTAAKEEEKNRRKRLANSGYGTKGKIVNQTEVTSGDAKEDEIEKKEKK